MKKPISRIHIACIALAALFVATLFVACGGNAGGVVTPPTTVTSVTVTCNPTSVQVGQTSQCSATVQGTGSYSSGVKWSVPAAAGTITTSGLFTSSGVGTAVITANSIQAGYTNVSGSANVVVTAIPITVTSVSLAASATNISPTQTATLTPTVVVTGGGNNAVNLSITPTTGATLSDTTSVASGTAVVFTPSPTLAATTTFSVVATSVQDPTKSSAPVTITVTVPVPTTAVINKITPPAGRCDKECFVTLEFDGVGFASGQKVVSDHDTNPASVVQSVQFVSSTKMIVRIGLGSRSWSTRWFKFSVCNADGTNCSNQMPWAFTGDQNTLVVSKSGELFSLDQSQFDALKNGYVRKFKADGTLETSWLVGGLAHTIAYDSANDHILVTPSGRGGIGIWDINGNDLPGVSVGKNPVAAIKVLNGYVAYTSPSDGLLGAEPVDGSQAAKTVSVGSQPWGLSAQTSGSDSVASVVTRGGSPAYYQVNVPSLTIKNSAPLTGCSSVSSLASAAPGTGGWYVEVFEAGPATGLSGVLCAGDSLLLIFDAALHETQSIALDGIPFRIAQDPAHGVVIIEYILPADLAAGKTIVHFASVDPFTGVKKTLTSTSSILGTGLQVSPDGNNLYLTMGDLEDTIPNK